MNFTSLLLLLCVAVCTAEVYVMEVDEDELMSHPHPEQYIHNLIRHRRQINLDHKVGDNGKVFGQLGGQGDTLYGKGGYEHTLINDNRGKLSAQAYGKRVLSPYGDSSHVGGGLDWKNPNSQASVDVSRQIHGPTSLNAAAGLRYDINKNSDISAQGTYRRTFGYGKPDYGGLVNYNYRF